MILALIIIPIVFAILRLSLKTIFKLVVNAIVGFLILFFINALISLVGETIPFNFFNTLFVGFFGVPAALILVVYYLWIK